MTSQASLLKQLLDVEIGRRVAVEAYCQLLQAQLRMLATEVGEARAQILAWQHLVRILKSSSEYQLIEKGTIQWANINRMSTTTIYVHRRARFISSRAPNTPG